MPSAAYQRWTTVRRRELDEIAHAHAAVGGTRRGRRYATRQINHAYAVLLASQFQGFCRDLYTNCADYLAAAVASPFLQRIVRVEWAWNRQLDRGNAQPASLGADFGRLGIDFRTEALAYDLRTAGRRALLGEMNSWRNAIAHQDFSPAQLGGTITLRLAHVQRWRNACSQLAMTFDEVMRRHLLGVTGASPW